MAEPIRFLLQNFTPTMLVAWLAASAVAVWRAPRPRTRRASARTVLLHPVHRLDQLPAQLRRPVFFHESTGRFSPFQAEVGFASLGSALPGKCGARGDMPGVGRRIIEFA